MTQYTPLPGSMTAKFVDHLHSLPIGEWIASAPLAEAVDGDRHTVSSFLKSPVRYGLVETEKRPDGNIYWRAGNGVPPERSAQDREEDEDKPLKNPEPIRHANGVPKSAWPFQPTSADRVMADLAPIVEERAAEPIIETLEPSADMRAAQDDPLPPVTLDELVAVRQVLDSIQATEEPARFALWSDGRLQIYKPGNEVMLTVDETRELLAYLERMAVEA
jgi:hypothetical protein